MEYDQVGSSYVCRYCKGSFDLLENLQKHVQQIHTARSPVTKVKNCPLCGQICAKYETYRDHLKHIHRQNEDGKAFVLKCFNDFFVWKNELEKRNYCKYIQHGQPKVIQPSKDKIYVYCCDSSNPNSKQRKKNWAAKDTCPSMISVIESATKHTIRVEHWNNHMGHEIHEEELNAAIGSLQGAEVVIDDRSYQSGDQDSNEAIYFLTESNDGTYPETYVKGRQRKPPPTLFQSNESSSSNYAPKKFSFKKDPTKKSLSFTGSLASVACMKATKKEPTKGSLVVPSDSPSAKDSSDSDSDETKSAKSPKSKKPRKERQPKKTSSKTPPSETPPSKTPCTKTYIPQTPFVPILPAGQPQSTNPPVNTTNSPINESLMSNLKLMVDDKKLNGQFILLNSAPGQNGQQSLILCPVNDAQPTNAVAPDNKQGDKSVPSKVQQTESPASSASVPVSEGVETTTTSSDLSVPTNPVKKGNKTPKKQASSAKTPKGTKVTSINTPKTAPSTVPLNIAPIIAGNINSLPQSYIQINNTLYPVTSPARPNLNSNVVFNPISSALNTAGPRISFSTLAPTTPLAAPGLPIISNQTIIRTVTTGGRSILANKSSVALSGPVGSNPISKVVTKVSANETSKSGSNTISKVIPANEKNRLTDDNPIVLFSPVNNQISKVITKIPSNDKNIEPNSNTSMILLPQVGCSPISARVPFNPRGPIPNSVRQISTSSPMANQVMSNLGLPTNGTIRSSLIQTNAQFVPSPRMLISQIARQTTPLRGLGQTSSTKSPPVKVIQLPVLSNTVPPPLKIPDAKEKSGQVSSVGSNTGPISSTPAISIPSSPIPHPQKPGSYIFESSGDLYMLEPIEDAGSLKMNLPKSTKAKVTTPQVKSSPAKSKPTETKRKTHRQVIEEIESDYLEMTSAETPIVSRPTEVKIKKMKTYSTLYDGTKIAQLPQKRLFKEDDSDILKKVKYYNLEMKYLSSQAECKRLKLELARVNMKNKSNETEVLVEKNSCENVQDIISENVQDICEHSMNKDSDEQIAERILTNLLQNVSDNQTENISGTKIPHQENVKETEQSTVIPFEKETSKLVVETNTSSSNCEVFEDEMVIDVIADQPKEKIITDAKAIDSENHITSTPAEQDSNVNFEIEDNSISDNELFNSPVDSLDDDSTSNNPQESLPEKQEISIPPIDPYEVKNEMVSDLLDECLRSFENMPEVNDSDENRIEEKLNNGSEATGKVPEQQVDMIDFECDQFSMDVDQSFDNTKFAEEQVTFGAPYDEQAAKETLKDLEAKYGEPTSDIYTMIRTSVLRSLYTDMQELCQENKKLFEELQSLKSSGGYQLIVQETPVEQP